MKELYVCQRCFGYSKDVVAWVRHTRVCEKEVPGRRVYTHGGMGRGKWVGMKGREEGVWSIWEVDGDVDTVS